FSGSIRAAKGARSCSISVEGDCGRSRRQASSSTGTLAGAGSRAGNILFAARTAAGTVARLDRPVWIDNAGALRQPPISPSCGGAFSNPKSIGCSDAGWSPDGKKIIFTGTYAHGTQSNIYIMRADSSHLRRVTNTGTPANPTGPPRGAEAVVDRCLQARDRWMLIRPSVLGRAPRSRKGSQTAASIRQRSVTSWLPRAFA
ncbi:MAG: Dipeptidyl peptidase N-terminal region, partial [Actinomycetota bacterium]|nr:Dipeptidyl peptidase N-terminal region [Actinomycetota bacterium]